MSDLSSNTESTQTKQENSSGYDSDKPKETSTEPHDNTDEFGYDTSDEDDKSDDDKSDDDKSDDDKSDDNTQENNSNEDDPEPPKDEDSDDDKVDDPASGYGDDDDDDEDEKNDKKSKDDKSEDDKDDESDDDSDLEKQLAKAVEGLPEGYSKEKVSKFALENKLSKEQVESYVEFVKAEEKEAAERYKEQTAATRKAWKSELKEDPDFGGENFDKNIDRVEKLLENQMKNTKKVLTEKDGMLPPYVMKDLAKIAKALKPNNNLVGGEPPTPPEKDEGNYLDDLYQ